MAASLLGEIWWGAGVTIFMVVASDDGDQVQWALNPVI